MKKQLATVLFASLCFWSFGQKAPIKFGDASIEDLKMTRYEKDTTAAAVILIDYGQTEFSYKESIGWQIVFERTVRIKILNKSGYSWADFSIPLYHSGNDKEKLGSLKGITYNLENGKIIETKLKNDATFEEESDENTNLVKFTLPNIKEGSVIDVTYKVTSDFLFNYQDWQFQTFIPTVWSEYRATFPEFFTYERYMQGYVRLNVNESKIREEQFNIKYQTMDPGTGGSGISRESYMLKSQSTIQRWVAQDVPSFTEEPFLTSYRDYISRINFELAVIKYPNEAPKQVMGSWPDLNSNFLENNYFGAAVKGSGFLKKITEETIAGLSTPQEKISAIYNYVKSAIAWNGNYRKYLDKDFKKPLDEKKGSSAEINLLLTSMLQKAGIVANPVLVSTRNHGFVRENMAVSSQFNSVICQAIVDGKSILLDATDRMLPIHVLPKQCLNGRGFIISKETPGWVALNAPKSKIYASADVTITADGQLKGKMDISRDGYFGHKMRNDYLKKGEEEYLKDFTHEMSWEVEKSGFENMQNLNESVKEHYEFTHVESMGNASVLYINPLLYLRQNENPFKLKERVYPVDFGSSMDETFVCRFTIPENYIAEELPVSKIMALPNNAGKYVYNVQVAGNVVSVTSMLSINRSLFTQDDYLNLREFYNLLVAKQAEQIVLKKKV
jgi:hypothetical protein